MLSDRLALAFPVFAVALLTALSFWLDAVVRTADPLVQPGHAQFARARCHHRRIPPGDPGDFNARARHLLDAVPVEHVEGLCLDGRRALRGDGERAVGKDAIDVEHGEADLLPAVG